jgi:putative oxidoreductase
VKYWNQFGFIGKPQSTTEGRAGSMFGSQERKNNFGLLIMRLGVGVVILLHSFPKLTKGVHAWQGIGRTMNFLNFGLTESLLGLIALLLSVLGAVSLLVGYFFRIACLILFIIFGLYSLNYFIIGYKTLMLWSAGLAFLFSGLIFTGPGRYAIAVKLEKK